MKYGKWAVTGLVAVSLAATGCSAASTGTSTQKPANADSQKPAAATSQSAASDMGGGAELKNQAPKAHPGVVGKVKSIVGNEVMLELAEIPKMDGKQGERPSGTPPAANSNGNADSGQASGGQRRPAGMQMKFTGETKTIEIPVGVPIEQRAQGNTQTLQISDIAEGSILMIYYGEDGTSISRISVRQGSGQ